MDDKSEQEKAGYLHSLKRNMLLTVIIVSITPMILVSALLLYQFRISYREKVYAHLETLVKKHKKGIDNFLKEKLSDIRFLSDTFTFEEFSDESFLRDRLEALQTQFGPVFVDLGVIKANGVQVAYAGPFKLGKALYSEADWFQKAKEKKYVISDVFLGLRGLPHFIIAVSENFNGDPWILRATIDFVAFNDLVQNIRIGETGFAFILNRKGEFQTKTLIDVLPAKGPCADFVGTGKKIQDRICITEKADESGEKNLYVIASLKDGDWSLVFRQRASDAFADFRNAMKVAIVIIVLGGLAITTMAFFLTNRMVGRIAEVDKEKEIMNEQIVETGKLASVGELAAGIAHEINNPVAIMVEEAGWIGDLLEEEEFQDGENLSEFTRALEQIRTQGRRCKEITHKLLSFARKTDSRIQDVRIDDLIEELVALSSQKAKYANVTINADIQPDLPAVKVSQTELQQVILNLINNAIDAMDKKGGTLNISSQAEDNIIVVEVEDNGPGIPAANIVRIFDPFFTTKPVGKGTGLGLLATRKIVQEHGGKVSFDSKKGVGSVFRLEFPRDRLPQPTKAKQDEP